ncbi:ADP-dependent glucokinase/phosphofructokinase [Vallitalea longa]|nr:ADP-dependent glucokinase/phosphofructokinase [Vallitalea longa]
MEDKYKVAFDDLDNVISLRKEKNIFPAMGYTSNLDLLCDFQIDILNRLLKENMQGWNLKDMKPVPKIITIEDLLQTMVFYAINGIGGEADIENINLVTKNFQYTKGMGGTATQGAMALATIKCPSVVHLTDDSKDVCEILSSPYIYTVSEKGRLIHTNEVISKGEQEIHCIIQFKKGDVIELGEQKASIPASNRLIITKITINEYVPFDQNYFNYIESNAVNISSNVLSSFNALMDKKVLEEHLTYVKKHILKYKEKNIKGIVFFEDAHYHDNEIKKLCIESLYSKVDIVSLNEEELKYTLMMYDYKIDITDILSCIRGIRCLIDKFHIKKGIIVHTKDYSMYVGEELEADIERGLIYGNLIATAKAMFGWYGTKEQIEKILTLPLSKVGLSNKEIVSKSEYRDGIKIVPSKYIDKPKYTIGLGDSFVAGVQICFEYTTTK